MELEVMQCTPRRYPVDHVNQVARKALTSLIDHYSDPVHYAPAYRKIPVSPDANQLDDEGSQKICDQDTQQAPYFDNLLGRPMPDLTSLCSFWYHRIIESSTGASSPRHESYLLSERSSEKTNFLGSNAKESPPTEMKQSELGRKSFYIAAREFLCCYKSTIHPCLKQWTGGPKSDIYGERAVSGDEDKPKKQPPLRAVVEILTHYELILSHFLRNVTVEYPLKASDEHAPTHVENELQVSIDMNDDEEESEEKSFLRIGKTIFLLANDIFQSTTRFPKNDESTRWKIRNYLLPNLLRLLEHSVTLLFLPKTDTNSSLRFSKNEECMHLREALATATMAAVSFVGDGSMNSGNFKIGSILEWALGQPFEKGDSSLHEETSTKRHHLLSLTHTLHACSYPPSANLDDKEPQLYSIIPTTPYTCLASTEFMTRAVVDFSVSSAHFEAPWTDGVAGTGYRVAISLLQRIYQFSRLLSEMENSGVVGDCVCDIRLVLRRISENLGVCTLSKILRANFYDRLVFPSNKVRSNNRIGHPRKFRSNIQMIEPVELTHKTQTNSNALLRDNQPHHKIPMRWTSAALLFCAILPQPAASQSWDKSLSDALPVALSLLDDIQPSSQGIGATIFLSIVKASFLFESTSIPSFVENYHEIVAETLGNAVQLCGREDAVTFSTICLAQSEWYRLLGSYLPQPGNSLRTFIRTPSHLALPKTMRKAVADILVSIKKQAQIGGRDGNDVRIAGALIAGVNPLLAQLAVLPNAASIEIGRLGLSTILPLLRWSGMNLESRSIQIAALSGLISLMAGSHPIMTHHGAKIMIEIFILLNKSDKDYSFICEHKSNDHDDSKFLDDEVSTEAVRFVAVHTAALTLSICGRSAASVLEHIESNKSNGLAHDRCKMIRLLSSQLENDHRDQE